MPVPQLNGVSTQDNYVDALTVVFPRLRASFAVHVSNNNIFYKLLLPGPSGRSGDYQPEALEHQLVPSLSSFDDPSAEGYPGMPGFAGVMIRSGVVGSTAIVTVI